MIQRLSLNNEAIATSGNYRKFRVDVETGDRYVHSINPLTGIPVKSNVLSASVRAADCMTADAYSTALMVLPLETSMELIKKLTDVEAYWITASNDSIQEYFSDGWKK
jgi:thiamine biosynthesis lipoprotein